MTWDGVVPSSPPEDADLDSLFQGMVVGITGLPGPLVRPRWQAQPPKQPEPDVDWCAIAVMSSKPDAYPYIEHLSGVGLDDPAGDLLVRHEELEVLASFYGPNAKANSGILRDGIQVQQNMAALSAADISFTESQDARAAPDLVNQQWVRRFDTLMRFRRKVSRVYGVQNIIAADVHLFDDSGHVADMVNVDSP